jgi:hypothetical protein
MKTSKPDAAEVVICEPPELAVAVIRIQTRARMTRQSRRASAPFFSMKRDARR